jgi:hypothetical protein
MNSSILRSLGFQAAAAGLPLPALANEAEELRGRRRHDDLLSLAVEAHGGMHRWRALSGFRATASITGALWTVKGHPGLLDDVVLDGETRSQRMRITPFPATGTTATWEPHRQTVETADGVPVVERRQPASSFDGLSCSSPWDELQVAYFASEANWNYLVTPFLFARPDFVTEEIDPWRENGEVWRRLVVTYPGAVVSHSRQQTFHFDHEGVMRRIDYAVDILGGGFAVHYPTAYREFDGILVPTRRRVYVRDADGSPVRDAVSVAIDITHVHFT